MSDDLVITGGGSYAVATDDQLDRVQRLEEFVRVARSLCNELAAVNERITRSELRAVNAPISAFTAENQLIAAGVLLDVAAHLAHGVAVATRVAMLVYGTAEQEREVAINDVAGTVADLLGSLLGEGAFLLATAAVAAGGLIPPGIDSKPGDSKSLGFLAEHPGLVNNPAVVAAARVIVDSLDNGLLGAAHLPPSVIRELEAMGLSSPELSAAILIALGAPIGKLAESGVALTRHSSRSGPGSPPVGWADRIARIPDTAHDGGFQIRIDKFVDAHGKRSFEVYLSGTQTFSTSRTGTTHDMTSNVKGLANEPNGALTAVELAMKEAGIRSSDPVNLTGHSQGGLLAHEVAASGRWHVTGVLEAGPPASQTTLPHGTPEVVLVHNEDVVPALGGSRGDNDAIVVTGSAFPDGTVPSGDAFVAHDTGRYEHTAHVLDGAASSMVNDAKAKMDAPERGATSTMVTTLSKAERQWSK